MGVESCPKSRVQGVLYHLRALEPDRFPLNPELSSCCVFLVTYLSSLSFHFLKSNHCSTAHKDFSDSIQHTGAVRESLNSPAPTAFIFLAEVQPEPRISNLKPSRKTSSADELLSARQPKALSQLLPQSTAVAPKSP